MSWTEPARRLRLNYLTTIYFLFFRSFPANVSPKWRKCSNDHPRWSRWVSYFCILKDLLLDFLGGGCETHVLKTWRLISMDTSNIFFLNFILFIFLYSRFLLVIHFIHNSVYVSIPIYTHASLHDRMTLLPLLWIVLLWVIPWGLTYEHKKNIKTWQIWNY